MKKGKGKSVQKGEGEEEDIDALLAEIDGGASTVAHVANPPPTTAHLDTETPHCVAPAAKDEPTNDAMGEAEKKALKNRLKKEKRKAKGGGGEPVEAEDLAEDDSVSAPATQVKAKAKGKGKAMSAAARLAAEQRALYKEAEERAKKEEEAMRRLEEEELAKERALQEEAAAEAQAKKEERDRRRKELGKNVMSKAEKAKRQRHELLRAAMEAQQQNLQGKESSSGDPARPPARRWEKRRPPPDVADSTAAEEEQGAAACSVAANNSSDEESDRGWEEELEIAGKSVPPLRNGTAKQLPDAAVNDENAALQQSESRRSPEGTDTSLSLQGEERAATLQPSAAGILRSPICCIMGHVDTGKTKLLDKIRRTNVQENEAGGITQQIGATFFPREKLWEQIRKVDSEISMKVPGLLIIDTPGHESFNNLRARGSSLCDIAILVVDIMHGLEPQTLESIGLLKQRKCPFVIALNKIDRLYMWTPEEYAGSYASLQKQKTSVQEEFETRKEQTLLALAEQGLNCQMYWENPDLRRNISIIPTSAMTGEGIPDLLMLLVKLTQEIMTKSISYREDLQCTILEVKNIEGLGTTIDVILVNGTLRQGETIVACGMNGPIVTEIRALLTPQPLKEMRVKGEYIHHKLIHAAMGVKIAAPGLEDAVAGTPLLVAAKNSRDSLERAKEEVMQDMTDIFKSVDKHGCGVYVVASTLGSLEALLLFLRQSKIPVAGVNIGTVNKIDVKRASVMNEKSHPEFATILAFDVKVDPEALKEAEVLEVRIMVAEIIYHLFDQFTEFLKNFNEEKKKAKAALAIFPCTLKILPQYIINKKDPLILGVAITEGSLRVNTPVATAPRDGKTSLRLGVVASIEHNKKAVDSAKKGSEVAIRIVGDPSITYGRQFDSDDLIISRITRDSIDCLKEFFRDEMQTSDWKLVIELKKLLEIM